MTTDIHALAGAYVLDAVDDLERAAFVRHLAQCASCASEVDELREAAARLADSTWSVPPPRLRGDVLAAIARTRQVPPDAVAPRRRDAVADQSRWRRFTVGVAAACVLAVGVGAATFTIQEQRVREQAAIVAEARTQQARTNAILGAADVQVRTTAIVGGGRVTVASSASRRSGVVMLAAGWAPAGDKALQLWTIRDGTPTNAGVLAPGTAATVQIVDGLRGTDGFGVTVEPAGGSSTPTSPLVAHIF